MDENFCSDMWWGTLGTIRPFPNFHPDRDAADIQAALERKGTGRSGSGRSGVPLARSDPGG
ncbi:hypothetical protein CCH79_00017893 [Gambusia affinis]|uniref:Uncharacterized protein n=1 Tax=Gambusia affinis TaxID=33528 RepID=A0A315UZ75_GAMAF|nr:hypothetical protein CCH79_00017893 [Gambusia affinis]